MKAARSDIRLIREYRQPPARVWRVLTDPALMAVWGSRPEGFSPTLGTKFMYVDDPMPGWSGFIECEVLEAREPSVLRYSWVADEGDPLELVYRLKPHEGGTRLTFEQTGFKGIGGFLLAKMIMGPVRRKMFGVRIPALLDELGDETELVDAGASHFA